MITFFVRKDEDNSILFKRDLNSLDEIPSVLINYLDSLNCYTQVCIEPEGKDYNYWINKTSNDFELYFD